MTGRVPLFAAGLAAALSLGPTTAASAAPAGPPRICWQSIDAGRLEASEAADRDSPAEAGDRWLVVSDGATRVGTLPWSERAGAGEGSTAVSGELEIRSGNPQIFIHSPGGPEGAEPARRRALWIRAVDGTWPADRLAVRTRPAGSRACGGAPVETPVLEAEAFDLRDNSTCFHWPLPPGEEVAGALAPGTRSRRCFPVGIPDLVGRILQEAESTLRALDLDLGAVEERPSTRAAGLVLAQKPRADGGEVATGTPFDLEVSDGRLVVVPDLVGESLRAARLRLEPLELTLDAGGKVGPDEAGLDTALLTVSAHTPGPGETAAMGSSVGARITARLPDLRRLTVAEARRRVGSLGLRLAVDVDRERLAGIDPQAVKIAIHAPAAGESIDYGDEVAAEVGVEIPDLRGRPAPAAAQALEDLGFALGRGWDRAALLTSAPPSLAALEPRRGSIAPPGSTVDGSFRAEIPDLRAGGPSQAMAALADRGLAAAAGFEAARDLEAAAPGRVRVRSQSPAAGLLLPLGRPVAAEFDVVVPRLDGLDGAAAAGLLEGRGLRLGEVAAYVSTSAPESVVRQRPAPGSWAPLGSTVTLLTALEPPPVPPHRVPWGWILLALALAAALAQQAVRPRKLHPDLTVEAATDAGRQAIVSSGRPGSQEPAVRIRFVWDPGAQQVEESGG